MPVRLLRDGILTSSRIAKLDWAEEVFYRRLMSVVDDYGRYYADPGMLRAACYPRQLQKVLDADIGRWLESLKAAGLVNLYVVDGEPYLEMLDFRQQVRAKTSKYPDPQSGCIAVAKHSHTNAHLDVDVDVDVDVDEDVDDKTPRASAPKKRKTSMTEDWQLPSDYAAFAHTERPDMTAGQVFSLALAFRDHWLGKGEARANWLASWRTWVRNDLKFNKLAGRMRSVHDKRTATAQAMYGPGDSNDRQPTDITAESKRVA